MKNSLLFQLILRLSDKQIREIKKWVRSPIYNHREDVGNLFDLLAKTVKAGKKEIPKEVAFRKLYPSKKFDDGKIRLVMTFLQKNIEQYLVHQAFNHEGTEDIKLATIYRKMNLNKHFERQIKKIAKEQEKAQHKNANFYEHKFKIGWEKHHFASIKRRQGNVHLQEIGDNLDIAYFVRKLEQACYTIAHQNIFKKEYKLALLDQIILHIEQEKLHEIPVVSIYYHCYQALDKDPDTGWFQKFRVELEKHKMLFPEEELSELYLLALNFCIRQYNAGNIGYLEEKFNLYKECLEGGYLNKDGYLSRFTYRNFMTVCIAANKLEYAAIFNEEYASKMEPQYQETAYSFNSARLAYRQKKYKDALLLLQKIEFDELYIQISAKIIMLKIFYETEEWDIFSTFLDNMKTQIYRKKDIGYHKENYLTFLKYAKKILELPKLTKDEKSALIDNINQEKIIAERAWLKSQILNQSKGIGKK